LRYLRVSDFKHYPGASIVLKHENVVKSLDSHAQEQWKPTGHALAQCNNQSWAVISSSKKEPACNGWIYGPLTQSCSISLSSGNLSFIHKVFTNQQKQLKSPIIEILGGIFEIFRRVQNHFLQLPPISQSHTPVPLPDCNRARSLLPSFVSRCKHLAENTLGSESFAETCDH
jgi:hypothetical protein